MSKFGACLDDLDTLQHPPQGLLDERVVGASEDHRVYVRRPQRVRVVAQHPKQRVVPRLAGLDRRSQSRAGDAGDLDAGIIGADHPLVTSARHGRLGREQADAPIAGGLGCGARLRPHDAHDRHVDVGLQELERRGGRRVARDDDQLGVLCDEPVGDRERAFLQLTGRLLSVWEPRRVAEVHEVLGGQRDQTFLEDRQPADSGIEDADRMVRGVDHSPAGRVIVR